jgi:hypothetical protein
MGIALVVSIASGTPAVAAAGRVAGEKLDSGLGELTQRRDRTGGAQSGLQAEEAAARR